MIDKVYHLADIHIRNLQRHSEYREVFTAFLEQVKKDDIKNSIIYLAGDLAHAKTDLSPELVREISWFLTECSKLRETFLITGNHDCFTADHKVLTKYGWIRLDEYINSNYDYEVATFNTDTMEIEFEAPTGTIKKPFNGELIHLQGKDVDQIVTPTHDILHTWSEYPEKFHKKSAENIKLRTPIPLNGIVQEYTPNTFAELLGFSFADGTFINKHKINDTWCVQFHLKKTRKINYLSKLLTSLDYRFNTCPQKDGTTYIRIYSTLAKEICKFFGGRKEIPVSILEKSNSFHRSFLHGYLQGDGNTSRTEKSNFWWFSSINEQSIDLLFTISRLSGFSSRISDRITHGNYKNSKQQFGASCIDSNKVRNSLISKISKLQYNDNVYCLNVPNSNLLIRHNNKISISGNCNLNNSHRLDVLTPIIDNLNNPRIHYLRDTGVYKHENLTFVVYSILDHKDNWPSGYDVDGDNKICLFHGPVNKAETDIGYTVASNSFNVRMFDGFDMALLGDIHKRQTLQDYQEMLLEVSKEDVKEYTDKGWIVAKEVDDENVIVYLKKPKVAYAGSIIQQNHGELLENHGYLLWDVKDRTFTEHHIFNNHGYLTIDVVNGEIPQWVYDEVDTKLPKYPRLRLRFTNTDASSMKLCITALKQLFKTPEVTVTRTDTIGQLKSNKRLNKNIVGNVTDTTFQNQLLTDYLERQFLLGDDDLNKIIAINTELNGRIGESELAENILWTPKTFEFDNMFSYGERNKIDFTKTNGIIGIFAPNASGKSSLFDALSFCIFDKTSRSNLSRNIINNQKENFTCKFNFEIDGVDYYIERKAKYVRKGKAVKVDVNFWKVEDGIEITLNGEQRSATNKNIEKYLGKFEDFILTTLSLQGNNALFIDKSQAERKETLSQFIGIDIFDKLFQKASDENRDNSAIIRKFNADDFTAKLASCTLSLDEYSTKYNETEEKLNDANTTVQQLNKKLVSLNGKIVKLNSDLNDISQLKQKKKTLENKINNIREKLTKSQLRITKLEDLQLKLDDIIDKYDEELLKPNVDKLNKIEEDLSKYNNEIDKLNIKISSNIEHREHLEKHKYNPECDICMDNSKSIIESKKLSEEQYTKLINSKNELEEKCSVLIQESKLYEKDKQDLDTLNDAKEKESTVDRELSTLLSRVSAFETDEVTAVNELQKQENLIDEYYKNEEQIQKNKSILDEIKGVRADLKAAEQKSSKLNKELLRINGKVSSFKSQKASIEQRIDEVKELEKETKLFKYYLNALNKDGISYELIEKALPMIEGEVNNILAQIVEFGMQLEIDGKNINAYLVYGDQRWGLEMSSGMERFISGLAIRVALINICNLPRPNFLVIDEGFGTLDSENLQSLFMLFTYLKTQFDFVMVISHIDSMRDVTDNLIEIKKLNGFSHVKF